MMTLAEKLRLLECFSYVAECISGTYPQSAKHGILSLIEYIEQNNSLNDTEKKELLADLESAHEGLSNPDYQAPIIPIGRQSRRLWKIVFAELEVDEIGVIMPTLNRPRMWFPKLESATDKRVLMGVYLQEGWEKPAMEDYRDLLALKIQDLADMLTPEKAMEIAEDALGSFVLMGEASDLGAIIVEADTPLDVLILDVIDELMSAEPCLPESERLELEELAKELTFEGFVNGF